MLSSHLSHMWHAQPSNRPAECIPGFWTGVSSLVDWFFIALSLCCFDASTDTLVRVSTAAATLFQDNAACTYLCVRLGVYVRTTAGRDGEASGVSDTPASGLQPGESWCQGGKHKHTHATENQCHI